MTTMSPEDDENKDTEAEKAVILAYQKKLQSLEAYHRRLEAEASAREAEANRAAAPIVLGIAGCWLLGNIIKRRRRR